MILAVLTDHITSNFLNGVFYKFYLVYFWINCLTCEWLLLIFKNFSYQLGKKTEEEVASIAESTCTKVFDVSINRVVILKVDPWRLWVCKQWTCTSQLFIYSQGKHFSVDVRGILNMRWINFTCSDVYTQLYQFIWCSHIWREFFCIAINIEWPMHCVKSVRIRSYSGPQSVWMRENIDQNNSEYGYFLRSDAIKDYEIQKLKA